MKKSEITLVPLEESDREQFILDNQWAFKHGALFEFGETGELASEISRCKILIEEIYDSERPLLRNIL